MSAENVLTVEGLTLRFGGLTAVDSVSFEVAEREIVSVIGPNGAGKTTVFNSLSGVYPPTEGTIRLGRVGLKKVMEPIDFAIVTGTGVITALLLLLSVNVQGLWRAAIIEQYQYRQPFPWFAAVTRGFEFLFSGEFTGMTLPLLLGFVVGSAGTLTVYRRGAYTPHHATARGIARTFQNIRLFPRMTALENVLLGMSTRAATSIFAAAFGTRAARLEEGRFRHEANRLLEFVGLMGNSDRVAGNLSYGSQRRLEIARALATRPKILLLDEPAAGMNPTESRDLMGLIERIRDTGVTVLLIEHHMHLVMEVSDRVVVLNYGHKIAEGTPDTVQKDSKVIAAYLGTEEE